MGIFTDSHQESILGVVEGFERVIFKGYFRIPCPQRESSVAKLLCMVFIEEGDPGNPHANQANKKRDADSAQLWQPRNSRKG